MGERERAGSFGLRGWGGASTRNNDKNTFWGHISWAEPILSSEDIVSEFSTDPISLISGLDVLMPKYCIALRGFGQVC